MQLIKAPSAEIFSYIETAMQAERIMRYMPAAGKDKNAAFALYLWNCALSEAFFISLHFAEIVSRNAIHRRLLTRFGANWFENKTFSTVLDDRFREDLQRVIMDETQQHPGNFTARHVVSALTFAFWQHLLTKRFERMFWSVDGIRESFPNSPRRIGRQEIYEAMESVRRWRNRIAHHRAIFDRRPMNKHQETLCLIFWACDVTGHWVASVSKIPAVIAIRPL